MPVLSIKNQVIKSWLPVFITAVLVYFAGKLTLSLSLPPSYATAIWPPAGISLGAVLLWGYRVLPAIFLAELLIRYGAYDVPALRESPLELLIFFLIPISSVIKTWLGYVLVKKFSGYSNALISSRLILRFFLLAGPVATFLPAIVSVYGLRLAGFSIEQDPVFTFLTMWLGDCTGIAVFTPLFLTSFTSIGLLVLTGQNESVKSEITKQAYELKESSKQLLANERMFRKLVQSQSAIVWRADPVTCRFLYVSDEAVSLLGYPVEQWINEVDFCKQHIHEDDRKAVVTFRIEKIRKQGNNDVEFRMIAADGRCVWLRSIVDVIEENGKATEVFGFMIDITRQKQAEEQLRLAATTFESQQGIMITDKNSKILRVNNAFTEITGYSQEQVIGRYPSMLSSGRHGPAFYQELWKQLATSGRFEGEVWNRRKNGEIYPEWQTITAVKNNTGEVSHYVCVFSDITEKKGEEDKIHEMAFYDPLTKLPNRRLLLDRFEKELVIAKRHKKFGAVIFLDLDHFKLLNDSQGHLVGDQLLIQVARRLVSVLRGEDTPARLGGDEFVVLLNANSAHLSTGADRAWIVADKIKGKLNEPFMLNQYQHKISTSIGITLFPDNHKSPAEILHQADTAMYRSKASGRNTISFFHPSMQEAADLRLNLEQDIRNAIDKGRFILCYQPLVDAVGAILSAEALIRWKHVERGMLLPVDFIPLAEESGLILGIGRWVLLEACNQIKAWQEAGINLPHISVNISSRQFSQQDFVIEVKHAIDSSGIAPQLLGIELTESVMIVDINDTITKIKALKALGISITVDNFGTGYSSLMYLKQLPIDALKIDQRFVKDILTDASDAVIIETIISMAHHLDLNVVAEGVETAEQLALLKQQGCQAFQGYHFSRPLPAAEYAEKYF